MENSEKKTIQVHLKRFRMQTMFFELNCIGFEGNLVSVCFVIRLYPQGTKS